MPLASLSSRGWLICCSFCLFQLANMWLLDCFLFHWLSPWKGRGICHFKEVSSISCSCSHFKWLMSWLCFLWWKSAGNFMHANDFLLTFGKLKSFLQFLNACFIYISTICCLKLNWGGRYVNMDEEWCFYWSMKKRVENYPSGGIKLNKCLVSVRSHCIEESHTCVCLQLSFYI